MKTRISALMDGELQAYEMAETLRALRRSGELRREWCDCQLVGAALRGERKLDVDVAARVMTAIDLEPTVMVPARRRHEWQRPLLALAASVAGVVVVAWLALAPPSDGGPAVTVATATAPNAKQETTLAQARSTPRLQEYLLAHQAYSPGGAIVGGARNIRTVAASGEGR